MQIYYGWHFVAFFEMMVALFGTFWPYAWHFLSPTSWQPWLCQQCFQFSSPQEKEAGATKSDGTASRVREPSFINLDF